MAQATATQSEQPAWTGAELAGNPHAHEEKAGKVRRMFAAIAPAYDLNNRLHSFGRDQAWRRAAVRMAGVKPTDEVLDVACGTGDLTRLFAKARPARVVGADFTREMLDVAERKPGSSGAGVSPGGAGVSPAIQYILADAMALPFEDQSFDIVSIAFGIRNVADPARALAEFHRVLRPGGRLVILEFATPRFAPVRWANNLYTRHIMPRTAALIAGDRSGAYRYLPRSISTFLEPPALAEAITARGFSDIAQRRMTFGVCCCTRAFRR